jgi:hypothetical protein
MPLIESGKLQKSIPPSGLYMTVFGHARVTRLSELDRLSLRICRRGK